MCARIFSEFYNNGEVPAMELAKAGKYAENIYIPKGKTKKASGK